MKPQNKVIDPVPEKSQHKPNKLAGWVFLGIIVMVFFFLYQGQKPAQETLASLQTTPESDEVLPVCEKHIDCMLVQAQCCDCDQGGSQKAINRKYYSYWFNKQNDQCIFTSCSNTYSEDLSCREKAKAKCIDNTCVIK